MKHIFDDQVSRYYDDDPTVYTLNEKEESPLHFRVTPEPTDDDIETLTAEEIRETRKLIDEMRALVASLKTF